MQEPIVAEQNLKPGIPPNSPIQEEHIDFLLEEEFACNEDFLTFFIKAAENQFHVSDEIPNLELIKPSAQWNCAAIRSVTTDKGESDVLVTYRSNDESELAILIEDKIRARFQDDQAERYRERGDKGKQLGQWDQYWTCLVAPSKYPNKNDNMGFDSRISLERLKEFFSGTDARTRFKRRVIQDALDRFSKSGIQEVDQKMTEFRRFYANEAFSFFKENDNESCIEWELPRDAWWDDTWFNFKSPNIPKSTGIIYKARAGVVDLSFANRDASLLQRILENCDHPSNIIAWQTGKSASLRINDLAITDFENYVTAKPIVLKSFQAVRELLSFYQSNRSLIGTELQAHQGN